MRQNGRSKIRGREFVLFSNVGVVDYLVGRKAQQVAKKLTLSRFQYDKILSEIQSKIEWNENSIKR